MANLLNIRVASAAFAQTLAYVAGWMIMSAVTSLVLMALLLSVTGPIWSLVLGASVALGWGVLATVTSRSLKKVHVNGSSR
jgi:hypothetical protein